MEDFLEDVVDILGDYFMLVELLNISIILVVLKKVCGWFDFLR